MTIVGGVLVVTLQSGPLKFEKHSHLPESSIKTKGIDYTYCKMPVMRIDDMKISVKYLSNKKPQ